MTLDAMNANLNLEKNTGSAFLIHWRAVIAGVFVTVLAYFLLTSLGLAIGATEAKRAVEIGEMPQNLGAGLGSWMILSILVSLFVGSYASGRVSGFIATRVGYIQGAVISALFFILLVTQAGAVVSVIGSGLGAIKDAVSGSAQALASNSSLTDAIEDGLGSLELTADPHEVAVGLFSRLERGDTDAAVSYLAAKTGMSRGEAQARFEVLSQRVSIAATNLARRAADAAQTAGAFACAAIIIGTIFAMFGGALGAQYNIRKPVDRLDRSALRSLKEASLYT